MKKIIILIICLFLLTGCYDYQELNDINIIDGISIDYKDDEYIVTLEMIKSSKDESGNSITTNTITEKDKILANAFNKVINNSSKKAYFKHVDLLLLSKSVAKKGIDDIVDYMIRDVSMSSTFFTVITDNPEDIFNIKIENDSPSKLVVDTITANVNPNSIDNIDIIASNIVNRRIDIALPYIEKVEENIKVEKIAYFKDSKMIDTYDNNIYNLIMLKSNTIDFSNENNVINIYKSEIKYEISKNKIKININGFGKVKKVNKDLNLEEKDSYELVEKAINKKIKEEVEDFLKTTLDNDSDLLGLKDKYYKKYGKEKNYLPYEVDVKITLNRNGAIYGAIHD